MLCLHNRECDTCVVVVEGFSDAKVTDATLTTSVHQHVGAPDVTVNETHPSGRSDVSLNDMI